MGFLARVHEPRSFTLGPHSLTDPALARLYGRAPSAAGVHVDEAVALTYSAVWDAVQQISSDEAKLPLTLMKQEQGGVKQPYVDSKLYRLLHDEPNPEMSSFILRRAVTAHALTWGNGYAEIERDQAERPKHLWLLTPDRVQPIRQKVFDDRAGRVRLGRVQYRIDGRDDMMLEARDILHIQGPGFDGSIGYSLVNHARHAIGLALASERFLSTFFANGSTFGGILSTEADLTPGDEQTTEILKAIEELHKSADKAHRMLVLGGGWKYDKTGVDPTNAQMKEVREAAVEDVARFFNMPLHKLKLSKPGSVSYASVEMFDLDYYKGCLLNWITNWEQELNRKLISPLEYRRQYFKHNVEGFLRGDFKTRTEGLGMMHDRGIINADEWRALDDRNPIEDGSGKLYIVQGAMVPRSRLNEIVDQKLKPKSPQGKTDADVAAAEEKAQRAEALAAELRTEAQREREARMVLEATGQASAQSLAAAVAREQEANARASQLGIFAAELRAEHAAVVAARDALTAQVGEQTTARTTAEHEAQRAQEAADRAEAVRAQAEASAHEALEREQGAREALETTTRELVEARAAAQVSGVHQAEAETARQAAEDRTQTAIAEANRATEERQELSSAALAAGAAADAARAEADRRIAEMQAVVEAERTARARDVEARAAAEQTAANATAAMALAEARRGEAETTATQASSFAAQAETEHAAAVEALQTQRTAELARMTGMLGAVRGLFEDAIGRMIRWEADKARRNQVTPEKLRKWLEAFYVAHEDTVADALLRPVRVHLAWQQSADDPPTVARALAREHVVESMRQLRAVAAEDPEDLHVTLERMLQRWEEDRPAALADRILREEVEHVRRHQD